MTKIYYNPNYQTIKATNSPAQTDLSHPLFIPEYYIPPQRYIDYAKEQHKDHSYYKCPAWKQYWANTFVVFNQMDINFKWQKSDGLVYDSSFDRNKGLITSLFKKVRFKRTIVRSLLTHINSETSWSSSGHRV